MYTSTFSFSSGFSTVTVIPNAKHAILLTSLWMIRVSDKLHPINTTLNASIVLKINRTIPTGK
jgi:hypothetical protein